MCSSRQRVTKIMTAKFKDKRRNTEFTVEHFQVKRVNVEAGVEVAVNHMAGGVDVRAAVSGQLHYRGVSERAVLHASREPEELAQSIP